MDLFDYKNESAGINNAPLADRMRPTTIEEFIGQKHILYPGSLLYRAIKGG